ncbi:toll/interleukin-1 receptor domain-containing protein [Leptolyngbya sp. 7M]|uniref:toll/interleukin-1 receptor domain-containing protein n=1 Tax=Leptolyngbya sp. 7M TaxID=2812896 RepID=UPI001B8AC0F9|nr:toll/interleukin-1 receptor domain-containing protein [Leptolyngbya sp. 7M]QYO67208.1 toll/interleukin-1 receptor domain-containing protein [Leptolyngbya sp. 7M]
MASPSQSHKRIWWDQDSIPLTAKWREEIQEGIEKSDNFVFLISPDSVNSAACHEEIEHAIKRRRAGQNYSQPQAVHWLNWLAQQMVQQSQTIFLIEHLQPTWSLTRTEQMGYRISAVLIGALTCWLIAAVSGGLFRWSADVLVAWLIWEYR